MLFRIDRRYGDLTRRFRALYRAYPELRYRFEEGEVSGGGVGDASFSGADPKVVMHEDDICKGDEPMPPGEALLRKEILEAEEKIIKLERQAKRQEIQLDLAHRGVGEAPRYEEILEAPPQPRAAMPSLSDEGAAHERIEVENQRLRIEEPALAMENQRLRDMIEALKSWPPQTPEDKVRRDNEVLRAQLQELEGSDRTRVQLSMDIVELKAEVDRLRSDAARVGAPGDFQHQLREFTMNTQAELETEIASLESRCAMAEEQLSSTNRYWAEASVAYQKEIMRLRKVVGKYELEQLHGEAKDALASAGLPSGLNY